IVSEVAVSLVLLIGAGLMIRSFVRLLSEDPGLDPQHLLTVDVSLPRTKYAGPQQAAFFQQVIERLQTLPGVRAAGAAYPLPLSGAYEGNSFGIQGRPTAPGEILTAGPHWISPDYFRVLGIRLLKGRVFAESDGSDAPRVIVINQAFVRRYFPLE